MMEQFNLEKNGEIKKDNIEKISALEKRQSPEERMDRRLKYLPFPIRERVLKDIERLKRYGKLSEDELRTERRFKTEDAYKSLVDTRFNMPNKTFAKTEIVKELDNLFSLEKPKEADFKKVGRLSFDLDGLKAVNDLTESHEKGDEYLKRVAGIFDNKKTIEELKSEGIEITPSVDGGDEFGIIIKSESDLSVLNPKFGDSAINYVVKKYKEMVGGLKVDDLVDFGNPKIKEQFQKIGVRVPEGYKFKASISGGGATLFEGLNELDLNGDVLYEEVLEKVMGKTLDKSDQRMNWDKKEGIKKLEDSKKEEEKFQIFVRSRNEEEMKLRAKIEELKKDKEFWVSLRDMDD